MPMDAIRTLFRRRWLVLGCVLAGALPTTLATLHLGPVYTARAVVLLEDGEAAAVDTEVEVVASRALARRVVDSLGIDSAETLAAGRGGGLDAVLEALSGLLPAVGLAEASAGPGDVVEAFRAGLEVGRAGESRAIAITYRAADGERAARFANAVAEQFLLHRVIVRLEAERHEQLLLEQRVAALEERLRETEAVIAGARAAPLARTGDRGGDGGGDRGRRLGRLEQQAEHEYRLYAEALAELEALHAAAALEHPGARVLSEAVAPARPSFPGPRTLIAGGLAGSLLLGLVLAFTAEHLDRALRTPSGLEDLLGVPTLALVPSLGREQGRAGRPQDYVVDRPLSLFAESVRNVLTTVMFEEGGGKVVLVTSSLPGEGKTCLATCLARLAALEGQKVVLVDGDLRHPSVEAALDLGPAQGLTALLDGHESLDATLRTDDRTGLRVLTTGAGAPTPTRLLGSEAMRRLLDELRRRFDLVVIDAAPILAVSDTRHLARAADLVLFAARWGHTPASVAAHAFRLLGEADAKVPGAVLTRVDLRRQAGWGNSDLAYHYARHAGYYAN
jgi:polysaccharide biosynthesis transport protein